MLAATIMVAVMSVFTACNKDDDNGGGSGSGIVGTWSGYDVEYPDDQIILVFNSDGTGSVTEIWYDYYGKKETDTGNFTYSYSNNILTLVSKYYDDYYKKYETDTDVIKCEIKGKTMYLYYEDDYYVEKLGYILTKQ